MAMTPVERAGKLKVLQNGSYEIKVDEFQQNYALNYL